MSDKPKRKAAKPKREHARPAQVPSAPVSPEGTDMSKDISQYVPTARAGEMFGIDPSMLRRLLKEGRIKGMKLGHDWLVFIPSLQKYDKTKSPKGRPRIGTPQMQTEE